LPSQSGSLSRQLTRARGQSLRWFWAIHDEIESKGGRRSFKRMAEPHLEGPREHLTGPNPMYWHESSTIRPFRRLSVPPPSPQARLSASITCSRPSPSASAPSPRCRRCTASGALLRECSARLFFAFVILSAPCPPSLLRWGSMRAATRRESGAALCITWRRECLHEASHRMEPRSRQPL
jgi:hypothetical protein